VATLHHRPPEAYTMCSVRITCNGNIYPSEFAIIQTHQLINMISNLIFHCNNCDVNRKFVTICENTAEAPISSLLNAKFVFKGPSPVNHFRTDSLANECPTTQNFRQKESPPPTNLLRKLG